MEIKKTLKKYGYKETDVAKALGITTSMLSQHLGKDTLTVKRLKQIADYTGIPLEELVAGDALQQMRTSIDEAFASIDEQLRKYEKQRAEVLMKQPKR